MNKWILIFGLLFVQFSQASDGFNRPGDIFINPVTFKAQVIKTLTSWEKRVGDLNATIQNTDFGEEAMLEHICSILETEAEDLWGDVDVLAVIDQLSFLAEGFPLFYAGEFRQRFFSNRIQKEMDYLIALPLLSYGGFCEGERFYPMASGLVLEGPAMGDKESLLKSQEELVRHLGDFKKIFEEIDPTSGLETFKVTEFVYRMPELAPSVDVRSLFPYFEAQGAEVPPKN